MSDALNKAALYATVLAVVVGASFYGGTIHEKNRALAVANKIVVKQVEKVAVKEAAVNKQIEKVGNETETKVADLSGKLAIANAELGRLRVEWPTCGTNANAAPAASARNAASEGTGATIRPGTREIDLDGVAAKVNQLGYDLDASYIRIDELQDLVRVYSDPKTCKVD